MKINIVLLSAGVIMMSVFSSCFHNHRKGVTVTISEDEKTYEMEAVYNSNQSQTVRVFLNDHLLGNRIGSVQRLLENDEVMPDNQTTCTINEQPGSIHIKVDKLKNPESSCDNIKQICEELKAVIINN